MPFYRGTKLIRDGGGDVQMVSDDPPTPTPQPGPFVPTWEYFMLYAGAGLVGLLVIMAIVCAVWPGSSSSAARRF